MLKKWKLATLVAISLFLLCGCDQGDANAIKYEMTGYGAKEREASYAIAKKFVTEYANRDYKNRKPFYDTENLMDSTMRKGWNDILTKLDKEEANDQLVVKCPNPQISYFRKDDKGIIYYEANLNLEAYSEKTKENTTKNIQFDIALKKETNGQYLIYGLPEHGVEVK